MSEKWDAFNGKVVRDAYVKRFDSGGEDKIKSINILFQDGASLEIKASSHDVGLHLQALGATHIGGGEQWSDARLGGRPIDLNDQH